MIKDNGILLDKLDLVPEEERMEHIKNMSGNDIVKYINSNGKNSELLLDILSSLEDWKDIYQFMNRIYDDCYVALLFVKSANIFLQN